jgi:hypothetical protein
MTEVTEDAAEASAEKLRPTRMTIALHSTPLFANADLIYRALDEVATRWNLVRVIAEEGSAASVYARSWCKQKGVRLTVFLRDPSVAERDDRARRWGQVAEERPALMLLFNGASRWIEAATILNEKGIPTSIVQPTAENTPRYVTWAPGMSTQGLAVPSGRAVAQGLRRGRPRSPLTEAERKARKADGRAAWRERKRLEKKLMSRPNPVIRAPRARKSTRTRLASSN